MLASAAEEPGKQNELVCQHIHEHGFQKYRQTKVSNLKDVGLVMPAPQCSSCLSGKAFGWQ